jgi:predicted lipoprotein with Yx(FWY)xxD motif
MRSRVSVACMSLAVLALAVLAGCGGGDDTTSAESAGSTPAASSSSSGAATVDVADNPELGDILVDSQGRTMYLFEKDESGKSNCSGACAEEWPPVTTQGAPKAGSGVSASMISTVKRDDGSTQVVFDGHPLYLYAGDAMPGDVNGNEVVEFGAEWYALHPDGENAEEEEGSSSEDEGSSSGSSGGDYSY